MVLLDIESSVSGEVAEPRTIGAGGLSLRLGRWEWLGTGVKEALGKDVNDLEGAGMKEQRKNKIGKVEVTTNTYCKFLQYLTWCCSQTHL